MKVVILCGGQGTRIQEATAGIIPKPMIEIGERPILWHIMKNYSMSHFNEFVLCLGYLGHIIKQYFLNYEAHNSDLTLHLDAKGEIQYHHIHSEADWVVTLADTGQATMTGSRLAQVRKYLGEQTFMLTYGDGVTDINFSSLLAFHRSHGKLATITGVNPIGRFGRLRVDSQKVLAFEEKPLDEMGGRINGGFMVFEPGVFNYVSTDPACILEREPLERLAVDGQLMMYTHNGYWQCMDTVRDLLALEKLWAEGHPPWRLWKENK